MLAADYELREGITLFTHTKKIRECASETIDHELRRDENAYIL